MMTNGREKDAVERLSILATGIGFLLAAWLTR